MNAATRAQLLTRFRSQLPYALGQGTNATVVAELVGQAWDNGWRDADWLLNSSLIGTKHPAIRDPAALFVSQLRAASSEPCPIDATPEPPSADDLRRRGVIRERGTGTVPERLRVALGLSA